MILRDRAPGSSHPRQRCHAVKAGIRTRSIEAEVAEYFERYQTTSGGWFSGSIATKLLRVAVPS